MTPEGSGLDELDGLDCALILVLVVEEGKHVYVSALCPLAMELQSRAAS